MRTAELAREAGVGRETLRYYERRGLLAPPERTGSGYRAYPDSTVAQVQFIKRAQAIGFSLDDVATLLHLNDGAPDDCPAAHAVAMAKVAELEGKLAQLQAMRATLLRLADRCGDPAADDCPILCDLDRAEDQRT